MSLYIYYSLIALFLIFVVIIILWYCAHRYQHVQREYVVSIPSAANNAYSVAPFGTLSNNNQTDCSICFEDFNPSDTIPLIKCGHIYHDVCLNKWLHKQNVCPLCKRVVEFNRSEYIV